MEIHMNQTHQFAQLLCLSAMLATASHAGVTVNIAEDGAEVVMTTSGTLDLGTWDNLGQIGGDIRASISTSHIFLGPEALNTFIYAAPDSFAGPGSIVANSGFTVMSTGSSLGFNFTGFIYVPEGVDPMGGFASVDVYQNQSLASMGLVAGSSYTWTWATASGTDFFTINVPAPGVGVSASIAGLFAMRRRRAVNHS
jgi:hypothetical protein